MKPNTVLIVAGLGAAYLLFAKKSPAGKPTPASITGSTGTAGSSDVLSGLLSKIPWNGSQPAGDNTPSYVTAAGGAFSSVVNGLKNLFSTPSGVKSTDAQPAAVADTFSGQTWSDMFGGTGTMDYNPFIDYQSAAVDYNPSDYYDWSTVA